MGQHFMYRPLFIRASHGFSALSGIAHACPKRVAPGIRPSLHKTCILLMVIPHFSEASLIVIYPIINLPIKSSLTELFYTKKRIISITFCCVTSHISLYITPSSKYSGFLFRYFPVLYSVYPIIALFFIIIKS